MSNSDIFPPRPVAMPTIDTIAVKHADLAGLLKVGDTEHKAAERVAQRYRGVAKRSGHSRTIDAPATLI